MREKEGKAVRAAEEGRLDEALQLLNEAVAMAPDSASVYNNRAQVSNTTKSDHKNTHKQKNPNFPQKCLIMNFMV